MTLLSEGLSRLCQSAPAAESLIAPRRGEILSLLALYIAEIEAFNPALGLVGASDREALIVRHILDSLAPLAAISRYEKVADVGSGAGLPGIPLAIAMPAAQFTLIERMARRARFLRNTLKALNLPHVAVEEAEMEKTPFGRFSLVAFRALKPLEPKIFKKLLRLCGEGGALAAYKGRREKIEAEMAALEKARPDISGRWEIRPCPVPFLDEERHLLIIKKGQ